MNDNRMGMRVALLAFAAAVAFLAAGSAEARRRHSAADAETSTTPAGVLPDYVGTWARTADACKTDQGTDKAPVVLKPKTYGQYETHCGLSGIQHSGKIWTANATCLVQGDKQRHSLVMTVEGDTMNLGFDAPKGDTLVRCK